MRNVLSLSALLSLLACTKEAETRIIGPSPLMDVAETESFEIPGLRGGVVVITTAGGVPHLYARDRHDLAVAQGFVLARDRWFQLDLVRRLSAGTLSELIGDVVLQADLESRGIAMTYAIDLFERNATPDQRDQFAAYAKGFNAYIDLVEAGQLPPPSELELAAPLLGAASEAELMQPWTTRDVFAIGATLLYRLGFETEDIGHTDDWERIQTHFAGAELESLRQPMALELWGDVTPVYDFPSAEGFGTNGQAVANLPARSARPAHVERSALQRAAAHGDRIQARFGRDHEEGWGSNSWAVAGSHSADGRALFAGDGHLELDIPALMYQIGLDTEHLGGGGLSQKGLVIVGMPVLSVGTNGHVAWSTTQHSGDVTDWYAEQVQLGADGMPAATLFQGEWRPVVRIDESYDVAGVLGGTARTVVAPRWTTFDGRWLFEIEGRGAGSLDEAVGPGEAVVSMAGDFIVPGDADGDGVVTGITFDFTGLDDGNLFGLFDAIGTSNDVHEVHEATRMSQALSQNLVVADSHGEVYYTGYEMVPCRGYLPRQGNGWIDGADPTMLLDGTTYGGFTIPVDQDWRAIEDDPDPYRCVVPFADYPKSFTPEKGFVHTANQDPGGIESDGDRFNDAWHIGGPWDDGYRSEAIHRLLSEAIAADSATLATMSAIQGHHESAVGRRHTVDFLGAIEVARAISGPAPGSSEERIAAIYASNQARFDEVYDRISAWAANGHPAESGVETFYHPTLGPTEADDAVATTIFNVWLGDVVNRTFGDEGMPGVWQGGGTAGQLRALHRILRDRGPGTDGSAGWNPDTEESVLFDHLGTPGVVETSDEVILLALTDSLAFLESAPIDAANGGFGTTDMSAWTWGLRHQVEFGSLIGAYLDDPLLATLFDQFAITTDRLPLGGDAPAGLEWFPRPGDNRAIDAANNGLSGRGFRHGSGPVMRMAFALGPDGVEGVNVIPGGQSGLIDSPYFDDQTRLWLANETLPVPITVDEVVAAALGRTSLNPPK